MTDALQMHVDAGENMYLPDDSHLNEAGETVVAQTWRRCCRIAPSSVALVPGRRTS